MPGCFGGKQLCEVRSYCQVSHSTHTNPNLLLTMEPGSKSYVHTNVCDDSFNITFGGIVNT